MVNSFDKKQKVKLTKVKLSRGDKAFMVLIYLFLIFMLVVVLYPLIFVVSASFSDARMVTAGKVWLLPVKPTLMAYEAVFKNPRIVTSFLNSIFYMVLALSSISYLRCWPLMVLPVGMCLERLFSPAFSYSRCSSPVVWFPLIC